MTQDPEISTPEQPRKYFPRRATPSVLKAYPDLTRGQQHLKVRLIQYPKSEPVLDIREYITSEQFTGFSKKGITLDYHQLVEFMTTADTVKTDMEELP